MEKLTNIIYGLFVFLIMLLVCGCGQTVDSVPSPAPVSYAASDDDWEIEVNSIQLGTETIRSGDGTSLSLVGDTVFVFVTTNLTGLNPDKICVSTGEAKVTDSNGTVYSNLAVGGDSDYYSIAPQGGLSVHCAMSGFEDDVIRLVFILPIDAIPNVFQFKGLSPIYIADLPID